MIIEYCEKCSSKIDAGCYMDPSNAAKYCLKCGTENPALVPFDLQLKPVSVHDRKPSSSARLKTLAASRPNAASSGLRLKVLATNASPAASESPAAESVQPPDSFNKHVGNMAFYFCEKCGRRLSEADLDQGRAKNKQLNGVYCSKCSVGVNTMELDAIKLNELSADQRKNVDLKSETKPETNQLKSRPSPHTAQSRNPDLAKKNWMNSIIPIFLFVLAVALIYAALNLNSASPDAKEVKSNPPKENKNKRSEEKTQVREPQPVAKPVDTPVKVDERPSSPQTVPGPSMASKSLAMSLASKDFIVGQAEKSTDIGYKVNSSGSMIGSMGATGSRMAINLIFGYRLQTLPSGAQVTGARFILSIESPPDPALDIYLLKTSNPDNSKLAFYYHGPAKNTDMATLAGTTQNAEVKTINGQKKIEFALSGEALALLKRFYGGDNTPDQEEAFFRLNLVRVPSLRPHVRSSISNEPELILEYSTPTK